MKVRTREPLHVRAFGTKTINCATAANKIDCGREGGGHGLSSADADDHEAQSVCDLASDHGGPGYPRGHVELFRCEIGRQLGELRNDDVESNTFVFSGRR